MHRFFVPSDWIRGSRVVLRDEVAHQVRQVLRLRPGDTIVVLDGTGRAFDVELWQVTREQSLGTIRAERAAGGEPRAQITLYQCLLKKDNFEWVLQKCTELGVTRFVPVESQRTVIPLSSLGENKLTRWTRIVTEAAEQSGRGRLPALDAPRMFEEALTDAATHDLALIPWEEATTVTLRTAVEGAAWEDDSTPRVAIFIGPEGGFAPEEVALAEAARARPVTLGPRILRAETAAVAAALLVLHELGDTTR